MHCQVPGLLRERWQARHLRSYNANFSLPITAYKYNYQYYVDILRNKWKKTVINSMFEYSVVIRMTPFQAKKVSKLAFFKNGLSWVFVDFDNESV